MNKAYRQRRDDPYHVLESTSYSGNSQLFVTMCGLSYQSYDSWERPEDRYATCVRCLARNTPTTL